MTKYLCEMPWLFSMSVLALYGFISFAAGFIRGPGETDEDLHRQVGCGAFCVACGFAGLLAWAIVRLV